jgi:hypothetical protein
MAFSILGATGNNLAINMSYITPIFQAAVFFYGGKIDWVEKIG